uniref:uncharacterized protein LOC129507504 isoform X1 n=1 Tax=Nyctereutes procyonoides TaxID=34880 RepID=UPI002443D64F|nr:uncharacterized protein LOC129507504 isoform X1 [Nyctereutes procyonoides]
MACLPNPCTYRASDLPRKAGRGRRRGSGRGSEPSRSSRALKSGSPHSPGEKYIALPSACRSRDLGWDFFFFLGTVPSGRKGLEASMWLRLQLPKPPRCLQLHTEASHGGSLARFVSGDIGGEREERWGPTLSWGRQGPAEKRVSGLSPAESRTPSAATWEGPAVAPSWVASAPSGPTSDLSPGSQLRGPWSSPKAGGSTLFPLTQLHMHVLGVQGLHAGGIFPVQWTWCAHCPAVCLQRAQDAALEGGPHSLDFPTIVPSR